MQQYRKNLGKVSLTAEGAWNLNNSYDILSIVYDEHTQHGFISRKAVPQGVDLYNKEYWMPLNVSGYADNNVIILSKKTSEASIQSYTLEEAIASIKSVGRRPGAILGFYNENNDRLDIGGRWELWQFNDTNVYNWENVDSWQNLYYNYNKFMGWFKDENFLTKYAPFPEIGCYAFVGSEFNEATVYRCDNKYVWNNTTQHAWDYVKVIVDGNVTVGENGNWFNNGEDSGIPASVKGENGKTPIFREKDNTIQYSFDNVNWITISGKVAAWFRWNATTGDTQANNVGRIQISRDSVTWTNLSGDIINNLHISRYIGTDETLPTSGIAEGTIYAKGPTYADVDTSHDNPIYRLWVYAWKGNTLAWQDNGEFTSIAAGVVQETGNSETEVMSQKAVSKLGSKLGKAVFDNMLFFSKFVDNAYYIGYEEKNSDYCYFEVDVEEGVEYVIGVQARFISSETEILINGANTAQKYTPTYTGKLYVSLQKTAEDFYVCKSPLTRFEVESYKNQKYVDRFVEELGSRTNCALSQKKSTDLFNHMNKSISLNKKLLNGVTGAYSNLLFEAEFVDNAYYAAREESSSAYCYFKVQVESGKKYRIGYKARFVSKETEIIHSSEYDYYDYTPDYTGILYVSYNKTYLDEAYVCDASINDKWVSKYGDIFITYAKVKNPTIRKQFIHKDVLNAGEYIDLGTYSVKYGDVYTLSFEVDILGSVVIGNGRTGTAYSYLEINNRGWYVNNNGIITTLRETSDISNYYQVNIITKYKGGKHLADIFIQYAEDSYSFKDVDWNGFGYTPRLVYMNSGAIKNIDFGVTNSLLNKDIFLFGDSYFNLDSNTWVNLYLGRFENKALFSGFGGCNSIQAYSSVSNLFSLKVPKYAVWCLGMNDGSDIDGTPSSAWLDNVEKFIRICESNFVVPILATIPTVPTINHESKNNYVRNSGYRYIDFAKAVGASSDGVWSDNMLSSDGIHPTLRGFTALFYRALMDVPELLQ